MDDECRMLSSDEQQEINMSSNQPLKLAIAMALLRSKFLQNQPTDTSPSDSDAQRWKRKAKERKQELLKLREELKEAEDAQQYDLFPQSASCKCYFYDHLGKLSPKNGTDRRFTDVLRRRFLRQVRLNERKRRRSSGSIPHLCLSEANGEEEMEQLSASADFLVELCNSSSPVDKAKFANWSHQAVDFILASLKKLLSIGVNMETVEGVTSSLIIRLVNRMCAQGDGNKFLSTLVNGFIPYWELHKSDADSQFYVQHLIRELGSDSYVGQRAILLVSQRISELAERLLFMDPFEDAFPTMHNCMFVMIQLIEFLVSDYLLTWSKDEGFDNILFEEWLALVIHARKALELLENRNGLYVLYMERVTGELAKLVGQMPSRHTLNPEIVDNLFS